MKQHDAGDVIALATVIFVLVMVMASVAAWATHVIVCLKTGAWGFLIAGALAFPIWIVHGIGMWFGAW